MIDMRRALIGTLSLALLTATCTGDRQPEGDSTAVTPGYGGTVVVAYLAEASSMNTFVSIDEFSQELQSYALFTTLLKYDEELNPIPYLAQRWDTAAAGDGLVLTFYLQDDVTWHDGTPTTAYDVKFTFDRIKDPGTAYPRAARFAAYDSAVVRDSFTVALFLKRHSGFLESWISVPPMPAHILGNVPAADLRLHPFGTANPVGNGPFRFVEHRPGEHWVFEANPGFPESLGGRPFLDRLVYRVITEPTTSLASLLNGEIDVYISVEPSQVTQIEESSDTRLITYPTRSYTFINWNSRRPLFRDAVVRRALTLAIDRQRILESVKNGLGTLALGSVPPFHWAFHQTLQPLPYDPDSAQALLAAAGWIDSDGDGIREREGVRASFELRTNPNTTREDILTLVQGDLAEVGVEVRPRVQEAQSLAMDITSAERRFDAFVLGWVTEFRLDDRSLFACSQIDGPYQWASYCNPRVDEILAQVTSLDDRSVTLPLWREYQEIIQQDQPYTFLYYDVRANGTRERVLNVRMDMRGSLTNVKDWYIESNETGIAPGGKE
ncbi:MAG: hypothetical protein JSU87_11150 [Gemmatimonadota bacterium]|nr:MAG: hypothetical protein JSU87_11150 [Gemmatimonadota bacterium]